MEWRKGDKSSGSTYSRTIERSRVSSESSFNNLQRMYKSSDAYRQLIVRTILPKLTS